MIIYSKNDQTEERDSAKSMDSGGLNVLATPALIVFMENTCFSYLQDQLAGQDITVSITGFQESGRHVDFDLQAYVGNRLISYAKYSRVVVNEECFLARLQWLCRINSNNFVSCPYLIKAFLSLSRIV